MSRLFGTPDPVTEAELILWVEQYKKDRGIETDEEVSREFRRANHGLGFPIYVLLREVRAQCPSLYNLVAVYSVISKLAFCLKQILKQEKVINLGDMKKDDAFDWYKGRRTS